MSVTLILLILATVIVIWLVSLYNNLVKLKNVRENAFADIDVQLKQRHDLIPQLVETVKGYSGHEKTVLENITRARSAAISAGSVEEKIKAENQLTAALQGLKISVEAYPELKANQNFLQLQEEISDIENKLSASRRYFNGATKELNTAVESFPARLFASSFGFARQTMFDLGTDNREQLDKPPAIDFNK